MRAPTAQRSPRGLVGRPLLASILATVLIGGTAVSAAEDGDQSATTASRPEDPVRGYFAALLDRRMDQLPAYVCDTTTWHSLLGSPAYGVDPQAWWKVLKFTSDGALSIAVKSKTTADGSQPGDAVDTVKKPSEDADKFDRDLELEKKRELEGLDKGADDAAVSPYDGDKFDEPFDPDKKPREGFDDSVKPEEFEVVDPDKKPLDGPGTTPSDRGDKFDEPFDPDKVPADGALPGDAFDLDKVPILERAVVRVEGTMTIGVGSRNGVKRQLRRSLQERFGRVPTAKMLDLAVSELAKGRRVSLDQDIVVARVASGEWLICPEVIDEASPKDVGPGKRGADGKKPKGKKRKGPSS